MNKEVLFAQTLEQVRKTAKEQGNCISEEQVKDAFAELDLSGEQLQMRLKKQRKRLLFNQNIIYLQKIKKSLKKWLT